MKYISFILLCPMLLLFGCNTQQKEGPTLVEGLLPLSYTIYTDKTELFVEFPPLITGDTIRFAAHLTELGNFKPVTEGALTVSLIKSGKGIRSTVEGPTSPGIFRPGLLPKEAGVYQLVFELNSSILKDRIVINNVTVYTDEATALASQEEVLPGDEITFLKEQAWNTDFANMSVIARPFSNILKTSGEILAAQGDETVLSARTNGIVFFRGNNLLPGTPVSQGETLFSISGSGLANGNIETQFQEARLNFETSKSDYERAQELVQDQIISERAFQERQLRFQQAQTVYNNLRQNYASGGQKVSAPTNGFIKNVLVREGQFVEIGQPLAVISQNQSLTLRAEVSQGNFSALKNIHTANFKTAYDHKIYSLDSLNGKLISYGKSTVDNAYFTPVYFEIDNVGELIPGSFVEVFLKTNPIDSALVIPTSALMEEQGIYYVYVQTGGESFEKREVELGANDGQRVQILSGVQEGERIVTEGAYDIKLSSMSGELPAHGHEH
ncbi:MAG: efflux RND transporter periplasmic adaptor subunit [Anditalea sp.]